MASIYLSMQSFSWFAAVPSKLTMAAVRGKTTIVQAQGKTLGMRGRFQIPARIRPAAGAMSMSFN
jgi:hypothetical protein